MPHLKAVQKLEDLCLSSVAENVDHLWSIFATIKSTTDPFDWIPEAILVRIMDILRREKNYTFSQLNCLLTEHLSILDFSEKTCRYTPQPNASELATFLAKINKCKELKTLKMSNQFRLLIIPQLHKNGFPYFSQLQVLDLSTHYYARDDSLLIIGKYCRNLKELNVTSNNVTDLGIRALCVTNTLTDPGPDDPGQCKSLVKLEIKCTDVTHSGVRLALENLPFLESFNCDSSIQALAEIHHQFTEFGMAQPTERFIGLKDLYVDHTGVDVYRAGDLLSPYVPGSIAKAVQLCPMVTRVEIANCGNLHDSDLHALIGLKNLRNLRIEGCEEATFSGGILPVLQSVGVTLDSFHIDYITFDILSIAECCPNLRNLNASKWGKYYNRREPEAAVRGQIPVFHKLETVFLVEEFYNEWVITADELLSILSSPCLESIEFEYCFHLTDELLERVSLLHRFRHLKKLSIVHSPQMTRGGIDVFMNSDNPLEDMDIIDCELISGDDGDDLEIMADEKNWKIMIECHD